MIKNDPVTFLLILIFLYPMIKGFFFKFDSRHLKNDIDGIASSISFLISFCMGIYLVKKIFIQHDRGIYEKIYNYLPEKFLSILMDKPFLMYIVVIPIVILLIYEIVKFILILINNFTFYLILDSIEEKIKDKNNFSKRVYGALFELPRSVSYVIIVTFVLNFTSILNISENLDNHLKKSELYGYVCKNIVIPVTNSKIAKKLPIIIDDSFKIVTKEVGNIDLNDNGNSNIIIYYNGVTLKEGIRSNKEIDVFAMNLVNHENDIREKAKIIYEWIGQEITYDYDKASRVLNDDVSDKSGAVSAFNTRRGICFDFACLYAAMCKANGIKVRLITGDGFNGKVWVSHAWNQVYNPVENKWINVDTTFSIGGDYFDSLKFNIDHKNANIAGEW